MMNTPWLKSVPCVLAAGMVAVWAGLSGARAEDDIKVGFNSDLSASPSALVGQAGLAGAQAAIDDINAAGGALGRKFTLVVRDDLGQPQTAIQNTIELINNEKVVAILGAVNSGNVMAWKNIANQKKVPVIVSMATGTDVTKSKPGEPNYIFRISLTDAENVRGLLSYLGKSPYADRAGFMVETTGYGLGALKDLQEDAQKYGVKPVLVEKFGVGDTDMTSQLNKMKAAGVQAIIIWAQATPLAQVFRSMEKLDYFPVTLTSWVADQAPFFNTAGKSLAEKPIFMRTREGGDMSQAMQKLFDRIKSKTTLGEPPIAQASHSYDATMLLWQAIKQAGSTDGEKLRQALENLQGSHAGLMKTYNAPFSVDRHEGLSSADYHWVRWKDGKVVAYSDDIIKALAVPPAGGK